MRLPRRTFALAALAFTPLVPRFAESQSPIRVKLVLHAPSLPDTATAFVTGQLEQLGDWNPGIVRMTHAGSHTWTREFTMPRPASCG